MTNREEPHPMIDAAPVARALRRLSKLSDAEITKLTTDRAALRRALVLGQLDVTEFHAALDAKLGAQNSETR